MQFELTLNFYYVDTVRLTTQDGVVTVDYNETTPLGPDSLLGEFTKASDSRVSETTIAQLPLANVKQI